ncbi:CaiB/BaiF CoA transferase family protein [Luteimonas aquatica]|uniref:CaiB/BaiF CoA transferase family protein n=1 Tax=Luteimonas aquatica TaxID=450364 RepID=UPI001F5AC03D|nr:CaiB/BaiF CoA-transferase family protein [Luteimonas aquatica]
MSNPLLSGIRILDLTRLLPGPFCTLYLAQLGAEVVKIEHTGGGDYTRTLAPELFALLNRGKESVALDMDSAAGVAAFHRLAAQADVVVESFRPGVMDRLGCGYETLKAINPRLVYAAITGYGQTGPYRDRAGHDMNYCGYAGVLDQTGRAGDAPAQANVQIADIAGGSLTGAIGILAAVLGARASGQGCLVDVSMLDGTLALQQVALGTLRSQGAVPPRGRDVLTGALPNYRLYRCRDGRYLAVGALEAKFFLRLLRALKRSLPAPLRWLFAWVGDGGTPDKSAPGDASRDGGPDRWTALQREPEKLKKRLAPLHWLLAPVFLLRTRAHWQRIFDAADCCATPVLTLEEALRDEQVRARGLVEEFRGKPALACPIRFEGASGNAAASKSDTPELGADTRAVLRRYGMSGPEIEALG